MSSVCSKNLSEHLIKVKKERKKVHLSCVSHITLLNDTSIKTQAAECLPSLCDIIKHCSHSFVFNCNRKKNLILCVRVSTV